MSDPSLPDPWRSLRSMAEDAGSTAEALPASEVRRRGRHRRLVRGSASAVAVVAVLAVGGAGFMGAQRLGDNAGQPAGRSTPGPTVLTASPLPDSASPSPSASRSSSASPEPTTTPTATPGEPGTTTPAAPPTSGGTPGITPGTSVAAIDESNLPVAQDLAWGKQKWKIVKTQEGVAGANYCQGPSVLDLGANRTWTRTFGTAYEGTTSATVAQFGSAKDTEAAAAALRQRQQNCQNPQGTINPLGRAHTVKTVADRADFTEIGVTDANGQGFFEFTGIASDPEAMRLVILTNRVYGLDFIVDYEPGGPVGTMHPMFSSLPKAAERLLR